MPGGLTNYIALKRIVFALGPWNRQTDGRTPASLNAPTLVPVGDRGINNTRWW